MIEITKQNFSDEVLNSKEPVLVDFWADWCGPCNMIAPILGEIDAENPGIKIGKIHVEREQDLARQFGVMMIPTLLLFKDGKVAETSVGIVSKAKILEMISK